MLPLSDGLPARRFPVVNAALIAANIAVWIFHELRDLGGRSRRRPSTRAT